MKKTAIARKADLCARSRQFYHTKLYVPIQDNYVEGFLSMPNELSNYGTNKTEPIVNPNGLYELPLTAWLTVNHYNSLVLNSRNMLIADIDFGDHRLNRFAGANDCDEVVENLNQLHLLDEEHLSFDEWSFSSQTYRVYRTHSGCRVICTSSCIPWSDRSWAATRFMRFLRSDPQYIGLCEIQTCYRARLTPKPWRDNGDPVHVCEFVATVGEGDVADELREQLTLHDELTLRETEWSHLA